MATTTFDTGTVITADWLNDVDEAVYNPASIVLSAVNIINVPAGGVAATDVQAAITELDTDKAAKGANTDITSLAGLTTPLTVAQGGTGAATHTAKGVLIGNGTSAISSVAPGIPGNVLTSDGTNWGSTANPSQSLTQLSETTLSEGVWINKAHSLGVVPSRVLVSLRCKTSEHGYSVNDEILFSSGYNTAFATDRRAVVMNSTNVSFFFSDDTIFPDKTTGAPCTLTTASWAIVVRVGA